MIDPISPMPIADREHRVAQMPIHLVLIDIAMHRDLELSLSQSGSQSPGGRPYSLLATPTA